MTWAWKNWLYSTLIIATAIAGPVIILLVVLFFMGHAPTTVLATWSVGAAGNILRLAMSVQEAGPLLFTGLAAAIAFRCGVWNIGGEGQFLIGAVIMVGCATTWAIPGPAWFSLPVALFIAASAGAGWALLSTIGERWRSIPVVLSTILLNFIAVAVVGMLVQGPLHDPATTAPQTAVIADNFRLPLLMAGTKLHSGVIVGVVLACCLFIALRWTRFGFEIQAVGLNARAAHVVGMPVISRQALVMLISGGLAGLGGACHVAGVTGMLSGTPSSYGYAGIAVAMLGRLHPLGIIAAALFMGMLSTGARHLERRLAIPHDVGDIMQGVVVIAILVGTALALRWRLRPQGETT